MKKDQRPQSQFVAEIAGTLCFDAERATGNDEKHLPKALGDEKDIVPVNALIDATGDPWTHPSSGGIVGARAICDYLGISEDTARRHILNHDSIRKIGRVYLSHVDTITALDIERRERRSRNNARCQGRKP